MNIVKLVDLVQEELTNNRQLQEAYLRAHWEKWADKLAPYTEVHYFQEGILYLKIFNSMAAQYMYMNKNKILTKINADLESKAFRVERIKWKVEGRG